MFSEVSAYPPQGQGLFLWYFTMILTRRNCVRTSHAITRVSFEVLRENGYVLCFLALKKECLISFSLDSRLPTQGVSSQVYFLRCLAKKSYGS